MKKLIICDRCNKKKEHEAKGLCTKCYSDLRYQNKKEQIKQEIKIYQQKNRDKILKQKKDKYPFIREKTIINSKQHQMENKEEYTKYFKNRYQQKREQILQERKKTYIKNGDIIRERVIIYRKTPKGYFLHKLSNCERLYKLKNVKHNFTDEEWLNKIQLTQGHYPVCFDKFDNKNSKKILTMDHEPALNVVEYGHVYNINDVTPMCKSCNSSKRTKPIEIDFGKSTQYILNNIYHQS